MISISRGFVPFTDKDEIIIKLGLIPTFVNKEPIGAGTVYVLKRGISWTAHINNTNGFFLSKEKFYIEPALYEVKVILMSDKNLSCDANMIGPERKITISFLVGDDSERKEFIAKLEECFGRHKSVNDG